jgi:hypothetical protein
MPFVTWKKDTPRARLSSPSKAGCIRFTVRREGTILGSESQNFYGACNSGNVSFAQSCEIGLQPLEPSTPDAHHQGPSEGGGYDSHHPSVPGRLVSDYQLSVLKPIDDPGHGGGAHRLSFGEFGEGKGSGRNQPVQGSQTGACDPVDPVLLAGPSLQP